MARALLLLSAAAAATAGGAPRFANPFQSHMVLQRGAPLELWGFGGSSAAGESLRVCFGSACTRAAVGADVNGTWRATLPKQAATLVPRSLWVIRESDGQGTLLEDVVVGDVFVFAGQSNVDIPEAYGHQDAPLRAQPAQSGGAAQREEEARAVALGAAGLLRIRIVDVPNAFANASLKQAELPAMADCDACPPPFAISGSACADGTHGFPSAGAAGCYSWCQCSQLAWARPTAANIRGFSATAWFSSVALRNLSGALLAGVPIGAVRSSKGGSAIDLWSSAEARAQCPPPPGPPPPPPCVAPALCPGALWREMMQPVAGLRFKAITWYQAEANLGDARYECQLKALIADWRKQLRLPSVPFVVVQLQPWCTATKYCDDALPPAQRNMSAPTALAEMRLSQAAAVAASSNAWLVTAMDLGSIHSQAGSCHSAQKPELGQRIAKTLRAAAYGGAARDGQPATAWVSPTALSATRSGADGVVVVVFSNPSGAGLALNSSMACPRGILPVFCRPAVGFEICIASGECVPAAATLQANASSVLLKRAGRGLSAALSATSVRYAYADWPLAVLRDAATALPALPFRLNVCASTTGTSDSLKSDDESACAAGKFGTKDATGAQCTACAAGRAAPKAKALACDACPLGMYMNATGQTVCIQCPAGTWTAATASAVASACKRLIKCAAGKFNDASAKYAASYWCTDCPAGRTTPGFAEIMYSGPWTRFNQDCRSKWVDGGASFTQDLQACKNKCIAVTAEWKKGRAAGWQVRWGRAKG